MSSSRRESIFEEKKLLIIQAHRELVPSKWLLVCEKNCDPGSSQLVSNVYHQHVSKLIANEFECNQAHRKLIMNFHSKLFEGESERKENRPEKS